MASKLYLHPCSKAHAPKALPGVAPISTGDSSNKGGGAVKAAHRAGTGPARGMQRFFAER